MPVPPPAATRRDRARSFSFFVEQNSGANAPRERFYLVMRAPAKQSGSVRRAGSLRRRACHRAGHFGPDPLAPALFGEEQSDSLRWQDVGTLPIVLTWIAGQAIQERLMAGKNDRGLIEIVALPSGYMTS